MLKIDDCYKIGWFAKPHGIKGEISLVTDFDLSLLSGNSDAYLICEMDGLPVPFFIDSCRQKNGTTVLIRLTDINSEDKAKALIGKPAYLPVDMMSSLDEDLPEWEQFIGYTVREEPNGVIGKITGVDSQTINILLRVDYRGNDMLIPVAFITGYDTEQKEMTITLPVGFWEI